MKRTLALAAAVALSSLTACGANAGNTVTPASSEAAPATATSAPAPATATATETPEVNLSAAFGDKVTFPNGFTVKVSPPVAVKADQYAYGAVDGKIVVFDIVVTNGSKEPVDAGIMNYPKVSYGPTGTTAETAVSISQGLAAAELSTVLPGETQTAKIGYGIPAASFGEIRMEVTGPTFTDEPAIFKGAVK